MINNLDIVYIWCDGGDSEWRAKRNTTYSSIYEKKYLEQYCNVEGRFRDNGELRYSLRSLDKYYPNFKNIFIITDRQVPNFLRENEKIRFIFHDEFLPPSALPTFSSKAIESTIPFIQEISENFIYMNDDVFFGPLFAHDTLFSNGKPKYYFFHEQSRNTPELLNQSILSANILNFPGLNGYQSAHTPKFINKELYKEMCSLYSDELLRVQNEHFRDGRNLSLLSDFYPRWMIMKGFADFEVLEDDCSVGTSEQNYHKIQDNFFRLPFFGINDTSDNVESNHSDLQGEKAILELLFPNASPFEK